MLSLRGVAVTPPNAKRPAVRDVSIEVLAGEWVAITGPNGCGKSSLLLAAAGLWPASAGVIEVHGEPLAPTPEARAKARLAAVLQEPSSQLFERTVQDELAFTPRNLGVDESEIGATTRAWAERLGVDGLLDREPHRLSAGQQQRVLLAAALASGPAVLLADEATAHLDPRSRAEALEVVRAACARGLAVLWVTQEAEEIAAAGRVVRIEAPAREVARDHDPLPFPPAPPETVGSAERFSVRIAPDPLSEDGTVTVPAPVEFELRAGAPVVLTGPNGSGKAVTLETLAGTDGCPQLAVTRCGAADGTRSPVPAPVLLAQYPELQIFGDSVADEIVFGLRRRGADVAAGLQAAGRMLAFLGLEGLELSRSPWALSTGERRLVQTVGALVTPGSMLLLDEPTAGLDPDRAARIGRLIAVAASRTPTLLATQDPQVLRVAEVKTVELGSATSLTASRSGKMD